MSLLSLPIFVLLLATTAVLACFGIAYACSILARRGHTWMAFVLMLGGAITVALTVVFSVIEATR